MNKITIIILIAFGLGIAYLFFRDRIGLEGLIDPKDLPDGLPDDPKVLPPELGVTLDPIYWIQPFPPVYRPHIDDPRWLKEYYNLGL